jgi:hypothetical protein
MCLKLNTDTFARCVPSKIESYRGGYSIEKRHGLEAAFLQDRLMVRPPPLQHRGSSQIRSLATHTATLTLTAVRRC